MKVSRPRTLITVLVLLLLLISSLSAQIYVTLDTNTSLNVHEDEMSLQLMAVDFNSEGERILQRDGGVLKLDLGEWVTGTSKTYTSAFAIVNPAEKEFNIGRVSLAGEPDNLQIHLHRHMSKPSDQGLVNVDDIEDPTDTMLYYDNGTVIDHGSDGWLLGPGDGYNGDGNLLYGVGEAEKEDEVWVYDRDGPREAEEGANFVWVEMSVTSSEEDEEFTHRGPMEIKIEGEYVSGPSVTFMAAGRRDGGPVIQAIEGNSIRLSVKDLKEDTTVVVPDAFALVNAGSSEFKVTAVDIEGDDQDFMRVYLHGDPYAPAGDYEGLDVGTDESGILYYDGESELPNEYWTMGPGLGYDEYANLLYGASSTATRKAGYPTAEYNMWMYDPLGDNVAEDGTSNFVWVEVAYVIPEGVDEVSVDSTITFHLSS